MRVRVSYLTRDEAAKESNLPSAGLQRPTGFEGQAGHQTPAAPRICVRPSLSTTRPRQVAVATANEQLLVAKVLEQRLRVAPAGAQTIAQARERQLAALGGKAQGPFRQR